MPQALAQAPERPLDIGRLSFMDGEGRAGTRHFVNIASFVPSDPNDPQGETAARHASWVHNEIFLEGAATGRLDRNIDGQLDAPREDLVGRLDWIGVNYYTKLAVLSLPGPLLTDHPWLDFLPSIDGGFFQIYPDGLYESLKLASRFGLPMYVTENGTPDLQDDSGETFLKPHLRALWRAIDEGLPVEGYFFWTLVDNYEWNHGMAMKLGLYALDLDTKARTLRKVAETYAEIVKKRGF